jgi:glycosyltransferase involved in cell wall biosynthesis
LGLHVTELRVRTREHRAAEFSDLIERSLLALVHRRDVFHVTNPLAWSPSISPTVASILDLIPMDMAGYSQTGIKTSFFYSQAARTQAVLTISGFTAERIVERFQIDPERVIVAPLFPAAAFQVKSETQRRPDLPENYVISLVDMATRDTRKRGNWIAPLAKDLARAGLSLVVVGAGTDTPSSSVGDASGLGRVTDEELARLLSGARCFLYFSAYEGQGLPPLEAMAAGAAVVATSNTAVTEIVKDGGILVDERAGHWSAAMREDARAEATRRDLVEACVSVSRDDSLRAELQSRGRAQAAQFSQAGFVAGLAKAYGLAGCRLQ